MSQGPERRVTPVVLTWNEEANIGRSLEHLRWADSVLVVDSGSTDRTESIVTSFPNARFLTHPFESFSAQWNYAIGEVESEWMLALDADYIVPESFVEELRRVLEEPGHDGYFVHFHYVIHGRPLRRHLYPHRQVLFRRGRARFEDEGHRQRVTVEGSRGYFDTPLLHDDRKSLRRWLQNQASYASTESERLRDLSWSELGWPDRVRRTRLLGAPVVFLYCLVARGLILEGWPGWHYTLERTAAELILSLQLLRDDSNTGTHARDDLRGTGS